jgi:uncharacterized membrane protein
LRSDKDSEGYIFMSLRQVHRYSTKRQRLHGLGLADSEDGTLAGMSYLGFWLTGLLFLILERRNRLVRFHAMQSLLFFGGVNALFLVPLSMLFGQSPLFFTIAIMLFIMLNIIATIAWFVGMFTAFAGNYTRFPLVGDLAAKYVGGTV